jgi:hypothetical protein
MAQTTANEPIGTVGYVPEHSYLWYFIERRPIKIQVFDTMPGGQRTPRVIPVPSSINLQDGGTLMKVGLDLGNNGPKAAMFDKEGHIVVNHLQAVIKPVTDLATGEVYPVYEELVEQCILPSENSEQIATTETTEGNEHKTASFLARLGVQPDRPTEMREVSLGQEWVDYKAIEEEGVSLSKGSTRARLADPRYSRFLMYTIANLFGRADYPSGDYDLLVAPGLPNEEMVDGKLDSETQQALQEKLVGKRWRIRITDQWQRIRQYNLKIADFAPGPQSYAGFYAWQYRPDGQPAQRMISEILLEDLGANDLHELWIRLIFSPDSGDRYKTRITASRERKGDGIILSIIQPFARRLKKEFAIGELDDAIAQQAFFTRSITVGGLLEDLSQIVQEVKHSQGAKVVTDVFSGPSRPRCFYMIEGGGNVILREELVEKLQSLRRTPRTYLLLGSKHASPMNAVGLLAILDQICRYGQS